MAPVYLCDSFNRLADINNYETRGSEDHLLLLPKGRTEKFKTSFMFNGAKTWNELPNHIRNSKSVKEFKGAYKMYFTNN